LLREIDSELRPKDELLKLQEKVDAQADEIRARALQSRDLLAGTPTPLELADEQRFWRFSSEQYTAERKALTARAAKLEGQITLLNAQQLEWQATWDQIHLTAALSGVSERVQQLLTHIQATRLQAREQLNLTLTLENGVSQQDQQISDMLGRLLESQQQERSRILQQDSPPLWEASELRNQAAPPLRRSLDRTFVSVLEFFRANKLSTFLILFTYLASFFGILKLRTYVRRMDLPELPAETSYVMRAPFSAALVVTLLIGTGEYTASAPISIAFAFYLLYLIPVLRLLAPLTAPKLRLLLYSMSAFYVLQGVCLLAQFPAPLRRQVYALLVLGALIIVAWLARSSRLRPLFPQNRNLIFLQICTWADLLLLAASLIVNIAGFFYLSQILGMTALVGPFVAAALYCGVKTVMLLLTLILNTGWARSMPAIRIAAVERWARRVLVIAALFVWARAILQILTIYDVVVEGVRSVVRKSVGVGGFEFSLLGLFTIALILLGGYVFAKAIIFLLGRMVFPRLPLNRGVPYAASRITYYFLLLLVCLAALSAAHIELNKFTVLTGALGVGIGFGLQNIVNNFVSGLILLLERPIQVGDTVEIAGLTGTVRRIGARSSTVLTYQGAEVIMPNSNLISDQVINWTLSSQLRRVDIPVRVSYGTDPDRVIQLLVGIARSYPGVLLERPPEAFFMGFGESSLNFELRFWCARQDVWFQLQSDMTIAVAKALHEHGIEIPLPQRDLHIRSVETTLPESLPTTGARTTPLRNEAEERRTRRI
jgi:small-conductance mechanosensitive channel